MPSQERAVSDLSLPEKITAGLVRHRNAERTSCVKLKLDYEALVKLWSLIGEVEDRTTDLAIALLGMNLADRKKFALKMERAVVWAKLADGNLTQKVAERKLRVLRNLESTINRELAGHAEDEHRLRALDAGLSSGPL